MKNNLFKMILISLMISLLASSYVFAYDEDSLIDNEPYDYYQIITTTAVNMRTGPGKKYPIVEVLPEKSLVNVISDKDPSGYAKILYGENIYYIYKKYLKVIEYNPDEIFEVIE